MYDYFSFRSAIVSRCCELVNCVELQLSCTEVEQAVASFCIFWKSIIVELITLTF